MEDEFKAPSPNGADYVERLKRDYIESTISLAESFARKAALYAEQGDKQAALKARMNFESFCRLAQEMIRKLRDPQTAEAFRARLRTVGCHPEGSRYVA